MADDAGKQCEGGVIYIVCNSRAERGPLQSVIDALPEARVIGFQVDARAPIHNEMAMALIWFSEKLRDASLVILLGDRYETLAAALAATFLRKKIAHIHGGETTTGAFDDAMRHSITHLTEQSGGLHFVATDMAGARVMELLHRRNNAINYAATQPWNIHLVGAPGLDNIPQNSAKRDKKLIVASYYPETMAADYGISGCIAMLEALESYVDDHAIFFSSVNADPGAIAIGEEIQKFIDLHPTSAAWINPNTREQYLHLLQHAAVVIGNSSAGVIEAPWIGVPSVNIGNRQNGREMGASVFCSYQDEDDINLCIERALAYKPDPHYPPIYRGGAASKIAEIVRAELDTTRIVE